MHADENPGCIESRLHHEILYVVCFIELSGIDHRAVDKHSQCPYKPFMSDILNPAL